MGLPTFLDVAGHPLRWAILGELAQGDLRVRELTAVLGEPQNLVSYHLRRLRADGLVSTRRSAHDRRDVYYRCELRRCRELLTQAGGALHPGLRLGGPPAPATPAAARVLFLCTGNSGRSQMAEGLLRAAAPARVQVRSAGSHPKPVHPEAIRVLAARGVDIAGAAPKHLDVFAGERFDHVVSLCDRVREVCPTFAGAPRTAHWSVPDPAREPEAPAAFARVADELAERIGFFLHTLVPEGTP